MAGVILGIACLGMIPVPADAAVRINEVAWMGGSDNANAEWIELFNTDDVPVSLSNWILAASTGSPSVTLAGSLAGKGFYLLERTSDDTVPAVAAGKIYTGALSNTGATLTLKDATGTTIDEVAGGTNWTNIGGDNTTKQTAQRSEDGTSWSTADPTPGIQNTLSSPVSNISTSSPGVTVSNPKTPSFPHIYIDGMNDRIVSTFDSMDSEVMIYDDHIQRVRYASIGWAFGDGSQENGYRPRHVYEYPGKYVVTVRVESDNLHDEDSFVVTVDDADIRIAENSERGVGLYNADDRIVTLSNWKLKRGDAIYMLPPGTQVLPGTTVIFPVDITGLKIRSDQVTLLYPNGKVATTLVQDFAVKTF